MTEPDRPKILRTFSGDSYGNISPQNERQETNMDKDELAEEVKENIPTDQHENRTSNRGNDTANNSQEMLSLNNECGKDVQDSTEKLAVQNDDSQNEMTGESDGLVKDDLVEDQTADAIMKTLEDAEGIGEQVDMEDRIENEDIINVGEISNADEEEKENIAIFINGQSSVDIIHTENNTFHLTEALDEEGEDNIDRQTPVDLYEGNDDESDISPCFLQTNRTSARSENRPQTTSTMCDVPGGLRAKANTPASIYNNELDPQDYPNEKLSARVSSRQSRDEVFHRAMTLMSNRCSSARGEEDEDHLLTASKEPPFGVYIPQYFYVHQRKPQPLAPLKAWRGYKGNVYFQPMLIQKLQDAPPTPFLDNSSHPSGYFLPRQPPRRSMLRSAPLPHSRNSHSSLRGLLSSSHSSRPFHMVNSSDGQMYVTDGTMRHFGGPADPPVPNNHTNIITKDSRCVDTRGLTVTAPNLSNDFNSNDNNNNNNNNNNSRLPNSRSSKDSNRLMYKRERICKGSNFHKIKGRPDMRNSKVFSIKISDPKTRLITPDNSRKTSAGTGTHSRMSMRKEEDSGLSANSNHRKDRALLVSGDKCPPSYSGKEATERHQIAKKTKSGVVIESGLESYDDDQNDVDIDKYVDSSRPQEPPRISRVHISLENAATTESPRGTTPYSENLSLDDEIENGENDDGDEVGDGQNDNGDNIENGENDNGDNIDNGENNKGDNIDNGENNKGDNIDNGENNKGDNIDNGENNKGDNIDNGENDNGDNINNMENSNEKIDNEDIDNGEKDSGKVDNDDNNNGSADVVDMNFNG